MTRTAFVGARLIDGVHPPQSNMNVIVEDTKVVEVSPDSSAAVADTTYVLDGRTLMPGMVVCHYHAQFGPHTGSGGKLGIYTGSEFPPGVLMAWSISSIRTTLFSGFTGVVSAGCSDELDAQLKMAVDAGLCEGPRILPASHVLETTGYEGETVPWSRDIRNTGIYRFADGPDEFTKVTRDEIRRGAEIIKLQPTGGHGYPASGGQGTIGAAPVEEDVHRMIKFRPEEIAAVVKAAHDKGRKVRTHVSWREMILTCIELGVDVIDHGDEVDHECLDRMAERGTYWVPSMTFLRRLIDNDNAPRSHRDAVERDYDNVCKMVSYAVEAGVKIVTGDDWGLDILGMPHALGAYAEELELWVRDAGIAPLDALRSATATGASLLGAGRLGTIEPDRLADLLVLDGDPTEDIAILRDPSSNLRAIMKDGRFVKNELV